MTAPPRTLPYHGVVAWSRFKAGSRGRRGRQRCCTWRDGLSADEAAVVLESDQCVGDPGDRAAAALVRELQCRPVHRESLVDEAAADARGEGAFHDVPPSAQLGTQPRSLLALGDGAQFGSQAHDPLVRVAGQLVGTVRCSGVAAQIVERVHHHPRHGPHRGVQEPVGGVAERWGSRGRRFKSTGWSRTVVARGRVGTGPHAARCPCSPSGRAGRGHVCTRPEVPQQEADHRAERTVQHRSVCPSARRSS